MDETGKEKLAPCNSPITSQDELAEVGRRKPHAPRPKHEQDELKLKVADMRLQGLGWTKIAKQLGAPNSTCRHAYQNFAEDYRHQYLKQQNELLTEFHGRMELIWNAHFAAYVASLPKGPDGKLDQTAPGKVEILRDAGKLQCEVFDRLQRAGFLPKVKEKLEVQSEIDLKNWFLQFWDEQTIPQPPKKEEKKEEKPG